MVHQSTCKSLTEYGMQSTGKQVGLHLRILHLYQLQDVDTPVHVSLRPNGTVKNEGHTRTMSLLKLWDKQRT